MNEVLAAYPREGLAPRLYRRLRLAFGGYGALARFLPERGRIVDLGCGHGLFAHVLAAASPAREIVAVDHDAARIDVLERSLTSQRITAIVADFETVPLPPADGIALIDVLHYLDPWAQGALLVRALRALRPGGVLLLRDPDPTAFVRFRLTRLHEALMTRWGPTRGQVRHFRSGAAWGELLAGYGLDVIVRPLSRVALHADRTVVGRCP